MPSLSEYVNVYNTALAVLDKKGFQIWKDNQTDMFCAERDGWDLMADNPISLLGLVTIFEFHSPENYKEYWWKLETTMDYRNLPNIPKHYR